MASPSLTDGVQAGEVNVVLWGPVACRLGGDAGEGGGLVHSRYGCGAVGLDMILGGRKLFPRD